MSIEIKTLDKLGTVKSVPGCIKNYRKNCSNLTSACIAAHHYAKKANESIYVVPGNSYGRAIYHLNFEDKLSRNFIPKEHYLEGAVVLPDGTVNRVEIWNK